MTDMEGKRESNFDKCKRCGAVIYSANIGTHINGIGPYCDTCMMEGLSIALRDFNDSN